MIPCQSILEKVGVIRPLPVLNAEEGLRGLIRRLQTFPKVLYFSLQKLLVRGLHVPRLEDLAVVDHFIVGFLGNNHGRCKECRTSSLAAWNEVPRDLIFPWSHIRRSVGYVGTQCIMLLVLNREDS